MAVALPADVAREIPSASLARASDQLIGDATNRGLATIGDGMAFPEWGHSYNALYVPLRQWGWQCALMPAGEVKIDRSIEGSLSLEEREKKRKERKQQIEQDKDDFHRLFGVDIDPREAAISSEFRDYTDFIRDILRASSWEMPIDGDGITRVLRNAVRDGHIIPVIDRAWSGGQQVFKRYAPQHWPRAGGVSLAMNSGGANAPTGRFTGPFAASGHAADIVLNSRLVSGNRISGGGSSGGFDRLGSAELVGGPMLGGAASGSNESSGLLAQSFDDVEDGGSLLGDAQPFEYVPDALTDDALDIAASTQNPGYAAQMLGYDRKTFGKMIHVMKDANDLGGADNVVWHDDGGVYFRDVWIDNMHDYAP